MPVIVHNLPAVSIYAAAGLGVFDREAKLLIKPPLDKLDALPL
jgi:hypothetical protein